MSNQELISQFLNLKSTGVELFSSFIKTLILKDSEKPPLKRELSPFDGYQLALVSLNLNAYNRMVKSVDLEVNPSEGKNLFIQSIEVLISEQSISLTQAFNLFRDSIQIPLEGEFQDNFIENLFVDYSVYLKK